jgi:hypothetical protein
VSHLIGNTTTLISARGEMLDMVVGFGVSNRHIDRSPCIWGPNSTWGRPFFMSLYAPVDH